MQLHDEGSDFAQALGLQTSSTGPLKFRMNCRVLRVDPCKDDPDLFEISVEFINPIQIL